MPDQVTRVVQALLDHGVALLPTDTVYGLAVMPTAAAGIQRLFALKGRPPERNLPVMLADPGQLDRLGVEVTPAAQALFASPYIPGPLTVAFGFRADGQRPAWLDGRIEVATRIPKDDIMLDVLRRTGPLLVTSANRHGQPTPESVADILTALHGRPDQAIDDGPRRTIPSTLVNCRLSPPVVEREGSVPFAEIARLIECTR